MNSQKLQNLNIEVSNVPIHSLKAYEYNARTHSQKQIEQIARSIKNFGFTNPILINEQNTILAGHGRWEAAKKLGLKEVPIISFSHLDQNAQRAYILADNKLAEKAGWDKDILQIELQNIIDCNLDFDVTLSGFDTPEIDFILHANSDVEKTKQIDDADIIDEENIEARVQKGDLWKLGAHYLYCGDSLEAQSYKNLLGEHRASLVFTDPPYNVKINGHVCGKGKQKHKEFAYASGEMKEEEFAAFLKKALDLSLQYSLDGSLHYICMDWRHIKTLLCVAEEIYSECKNICVWNKQLGGMGSFYRSQHEFISLFKKGSAKHINNVELGKHGRYRTNIWDYPGVHAVNHHKDDMKLHPTVKPVSMIADAILDSTNKGDIVLDIFGGSGSTLLAAEKTNRRAYIIELDTHYCDVILHRFEKMTGIAPVKEVAHD
jgi:DNA modification methylase